MLRTLAVASRMYPKAIAREGMLVPVPYNAHFLSSSSSMMAREARNGEADGPG